MGNLRTTVSGVVFRNCALATAAKLSTPVSCAVEFESASGYSVTSSACSFNQPVLFVPIIMQIECHRGAMLCQQCRRSFECNRLTECKSHGLWLLFLVLLMFLLLIHLNFLFCLLPSFFSYLSSSLSLYIFFYFASASPLFTSSDIYFSFFLSLSTVTHPFFFFFSFASIGYINILWGKMWSLYC